MLNNNIFYGNNAAWLAAAGDTNKLSARFNLCFSNTVSTGWESFGLSPVFGDPQFASIDPADEWFLHPREGSAADQPGWGGVAFIGALPPIPEPVAVSLLIAVGIILRRWCSHCC